MKAQLKMPFVSTARVARLALHLPRRYYNYIRHLHKLVVRHSV